MTGQEKVMRWGITECLPLLAVAAAIVLLCTSTTAAAAPRPELQGTLLVNIFPLEAVSAGAQWSASNGLMQTGWLNSGAAAFLDQGVYTISFAPVAGWIAPSPIQVQLTNSVLAESGTYQAENEAQTLSPPQNVSATDGTFVDFVRITWDGVDGATGYEVFREDTEKPEIEQPIATVTTTTYDDTSAGESQLLQANCQPYPDYVVHTYRVRAFDSSSTSVVSEPDTGYRGIVGVDDPSKKAGLLFASIPTRHFAGGIGILIAVAVVLTGLNSTGRTKRQTG
ncbi:MAG: hypothetical protein AMXMBFR84_36590 [Candidatus Hydrogenedentota bacterium]